MSNNTHPFYQLSELIEEYNEKRLTFSLDDLQDLRDKISILLFNLSDSMSKAISQQELADFERKRHFAERFDYWKEQMDENGKHYTVALAETKARIDNKKYEENYVESARKQQRAKIILTATNHILNSIASRISNINK